MRLRKSPNVPEELWLAISFFGSLVGMGWFALALEVHWQQVHSSVPLTSGTQRRLRVLGALALAVSLTASFLADHPSMAPLTWIMGIAAAALSIALILAWRPRALRVLMPWRANT
jgi:hypothetical protein